MLSLSKKEIRAIYKEKRKALSSDEAIFLSEKITEQFLNTFDLSDVKTLHCFLPIEKQNEIDTTNLIEYCLNHNIRVFVPKVIDGEMISVEIDESTAFVMSNWGIKEPVDTVDAGVTKFDLCIVPLLYADYEGNRVGYGKGFYDRFFENNNVSKKIGFNYFEFNEIVSDFTELDIKIDFLVTPYSVNEFY